MLNRTEQNTDSSHAEALIIATHVIASDSEAICSVNRKHKGWCFGASNFFKRLLRRAKPLQLPSSRTRSDVRNVKTPPCTSLRGETKFRRGNLIKRLLRNIKLLQLPSSRTRSDVRNVKTPQCTSLRGIGLMALKIRGSAKQSKNVFSPFTFYNSPNFAFTLSEVIITLGIIGVLAAMTIPNLISNSRESQYTESLKKFYSDLSSAMVTMQASDSGYTIPINDTDTNESNGMRDNLCEILSCIKKDTALNIWGVSINRSDAANNVYKNYKSSSYVYTDLEPYRAAALLKNGMFIGIGFNWEARNSFQLYVDTNGSEGPNMFGRDLNMFEIVRDSTGYYKPVVEGGPGTYRSGAACLTNQTNHVNVWPCSYYRMYTPDKMP